MTSSMKVTVTAPLVERAAQRDSRHCMIAEAILSARPDLRNVMVDLATIRWSNPRTGKRYVALTPEVAAAQLVRFDQGEPIEPFEFNLNAIQATPMTRAKETRAEARAEGRDRPRTDRRRGPKTVTGAENGQPMIHGGEPLRTGHLPKASLKERSGAPASTSISDPPDLSSNAVRSARRYRQYGRRLLAE